MQFVMCTHDRNVRVGRRRPDRFEGDPVQEWKCVTCGQRYQLEASERLPSHCYVCGYISFEAVKGETH